MRRLIFLVVTVLAMLSGPSLAQAQQANPPAVLEVLIQPGAIVSSTSEPVTLGGYVTSDAAGVLVAIRDNSTGLWWHRDTCPGVIDLGCQLGSFETRWDRADAVLTPVQDRTLATFPADLPPGDYQVGIRPVAANGDVAAGPWYQFTVGTPPAIEFETATATPPNNSIVNAGLVTVTSFHPFGSPIDGNQGSAAVSLKRLTDNQWLQLDGSFGANNEPRQMNIEGFGPFNFVAQSKVDLAPGRYGFWLEHYSPEGEKFSQLWSAFTVVPCSANCGNVAAEGGASGPYSLANDGGVCYSVFSETYREGGTVRLTILNSDTGQWVQPLDGGTSIDPNNITFGGFKYFSNLARIIQGDPDVGNSCFYDDPMQLPVGNYFMGIKAVDSAGNVGGGSWKAFTVTP